MTSTTPVATNTWSEYVIKQTVRFIPNI